MNINELVDYIFDFWINWDFSEYPETTDDLRQKIYSNLTTKEGIEKELDNIGFLSSFNLDEDSIESQELDRVWKYLMQYRTWFNEKEGNVKVSCLTALASLCDSMIVNKQLNVTEEDIVQFMASWLKIHNINLLCLDEFLTEEELKECKENRRKRYLKNLRSTPRYKEMRKEWDKKYRDKKKGRR